jgi:hypothetical protein
MSKRCNKCGCTKDAALFSKDRRQKDGLQTYCKPCRKAVCKQWRKGNIDQVVAYKKAYRSANQEAVAAYEAGYRNANREARAESNRKYNDANRDSRVDYSRRYRTANPEKVRETHRNHKRKKRRSDPWFKMSCSLRTRQWQFFKGTQRPASMVRDMGCEPEFFLRHIASQFTAGMTMENYGKFWHLDHIYPLAAADIVNNRIHFLAVANWRNLQPMLGPENVEKKDKVTPEAQALFDALCQEFLAHAK